MQRERIPAKRKECFDSVQTQAFYELLQHDPSRAVLGASANDCKQALKDILGSAAKSSLRDEMEFVAKRMQARIASLKGEGQAQGGGAT